jgi:UDP-glucose 4-epimerase
VVLTGGRGFLGKHLHRTLVERGHDVESYDMSDGYSILDGQQLDDFLRPFRPHAVVHLAACSDLNVYQASPMVSQHTNVEGTRNVLAACQAHGARLLFASTCCCYGNNGVHPSDETSPLAPTELYAQSKAMSEADILQVGLPHCVMRLATFYGPEMRGALAPALFLDAAHHKRPIEVHGTGEQTRTMTYIDDITSGIITILEAEPRDTVINVTTEDSVSVNQMVAVALKLTTAAAKMSAASSAVTHVVHIDDRPGQIYTEAISSQRLQAYGWRPSTSFEEGMKKSYDYYQQNGCHW